MSGSSRYLINEPPILLYPSLAIKIGVNDAAILQKLHFLLGMQKEVNNEYVFVDEFWWVYNSYEEWQERYFGWLSVQSIRDKFQNMEKEGYVVSRQGVKNPHDRRKWYRIDYEKLDAFLDAKSSLIDQKLVDVQGLKISPSEDQKIVDDLSESPSKSPSEISVTENRAAITRKLPPSGPTFDPSKKTVKDTDIPSKDRRIVGCINSMIPGKGKLTDKQKPLLEKKYEANLRYKGDSVIKPSPADLYDDDSLFQQYIKTIPSSLKAIHKNPNATNFVNMICDYQFAVFGWLAYEAKNRAKHADEAPIMEEDI